MGDCLFCKMASKQMKVEFVYEDGEVFAIRDINPQAPLHMLVIPKQHIERIADVTEKEALIAGKLIQRAREIAVREKVSEKGFRLVFNSGPDANQTVYHIHLHLLAGRPMHWPPG